MPLETKCTIFLPFSCVILFKTFQKLQRVKVRHTAVVHKIFILILYTAHVWLQYLAMDLSDNMINNLTALHAC